MRRMAVINQKGGVGKTTTTANLGAALARSGSRVLLIDLDPQGHLSLHFGSELAPDQPSVYDVLTDSLPVRDALIDAGENIKLLPADIDLAGAEAELASVTGREVLLREALETVDAEFDYLLIDCPPSLGVLTVNALVAANEVLIPLQAHFLALQGLSRLLGRTVTLVRQRINPQLRVEGVILCLHESATRLAGEVVEDLTTFLEASRGTNVAWADAKLYETCIRRNIKLAESSSFGQTVFDYAPKSNGAADYARLAQEIFFPPAVSEPVIPKAAPVEVVPPAEPVPRADEPVSPRVPVEAVNPPGAIAPRVEAAPRKVEPVPPRASVVRVGPAVVDRPDVPVAREEPVASVDERPEPQPEPQTRTVVVPPPPVEARRSEPAPVPTAMAMITLGSGPPKRVRVAVVKQPTARVAPPPPPRTPMPWAERPQVVDRSSSLVPAPVERPPAAPKAQVHVASPARPDGPSGTEPVPENSLDPKPCSGDTPQAPPASAPSAVATAL